MRTLLVVAVLLLAGIVGVGFYRGWFAFTAKNEDQKPSATITVDKEKIVKATLLPRVIILRAYARWTALSALRSGAPIKSRDNIYPLLREERFARLEDRSLGPIDAEEFNRWHKDACAAMIVEEKRLQVGWAAKLLNVYLKTYAYVGGAGRQGLASVIHPPIDGGLWQGLKRECAACPKILKLTHCVDRIKNIVDYACYRQIIEGCQLAAKELGCTLIEVEQLWTGTEISSEEE